MESGILILEEAPKEADFPREAFEAMNDIETMHFWSRARNVVIKAMLDLIPGTARSRSLLDVGCGTGSVSAWLRSLGYHTVGMDMWLDGLKYAASRLSAPGICCNARHMPFRGCFDVVGLFDVIEHIEDDEELLRTSARALKSGGHLIVTVPADRRLWSPYDDVFGHKRRYTRAQLLAVLERAGLTVQRVSYYNTLLWPVQYAYRRWQSARHTPVPSRAELTRALLKVPPRYINAPLRWIMSMEALWVTHFSGFFGGALIALARLDQEGQQVGATKGRRSQHTAEGHLDGVLGQCA